MASLAEYTPLADMQAMQTRHLGWAGDIDVWAMPEGTPLPIYDKGGIAVFSNRSRGQIAHFVFFKDMPDRWFGVHGMLRNCDAALSARTYRAYLIPSGKSQGATSA